MSKVILLSAAWTANDVDFEALGEGDTQHPGIALAEGPDSQTTSPASADVRPGPYAATSPAPAPVGSVGSGVTDGGAGDSRDASRRTDRVSVAAGAVIGAAAATAVTGARRLRRR